MGQNGDQDTNGTSEVEGDVAVIEERPDVSEPGKYAVVLHNDDYTTMEFVVEVLQKYFQKSKDAAVKVMLDVHNDGKGVAGIYSHDIAETKANQVKEYARSRGFPLNCTVELLNDESRSDKL